MRDALERSGYLLETRVEQVLRGRTFEVIANVPYADPDTGKSRELDLQATGFIKEIGSDEGDDHLIWADLLVECIHSPAPIAFFTKLPLPEWDHGLERIKVAGQPIQQPLENIRFNWHWLLRKLDLAAHHHYFRGLIASQYCSFEQKKSSGEWFATHREQDHEVFRKMGAATDFFVQHQYDHMDEAFHAFQLTFLFPIIVVQGRLLSVSESNGSLAISDVDHVSFHHSHAIGRQQIRYHIDVVTEAFVPTLLDTVDAEIAAIATALRGKAVETWEHANKRRKRMLAGEKTWD